MKKISLIFIALIFSIVLIQYVSSEAIEPNKINYAYIDENNNVITTNNPVNGVNIIGFICADSDCSSYSGSLWNAQVLTTNTNMINLVFPTSPLYSSNNGYALYFYKDGYIPYERTRVTWYGEGTAPTYTDYLGKKQGCISEIKDFDVTISDNNVYVEADIYSPLDNSGPLNVIPNQIKEQYQTNVLLIFEIRDENENYVTGDSKTLTLEFSDYEYVDFSKNLEPGTYSVILYTSLENEDKCLSFDKDIKEKQIIIGPTCTDNDNDGYSKEGGDCGPVDCNDHNNKVYPGATEICDYIDNDCDGKIDEGDVCLVCTDNDNDGYSKEGGDCGPVDCNDHNNKVYPGATEICDYIDNDCDGKIDEGDVCLVCTDNDNDGYSKEGGDCGPVDCNDHNNKVYPGATEICDYIDNDCDGKIDEGDVCLVCTDNDNDGYSKEGGDCGPVDCNDHNNKVYPGATEICDNGIDDNCNGKIDEGCFVDLFPEITLISADPTRGFIPLKVYFDCEAQSGNGDLTYSWDFGDGQNSYSQDPSHTYEVAGNYKATCTVTDEDGDKDTGKVNIEAVKDIINVEEINCFETVVENNNQSCSVFVKNSLGEPVGGANIDVFYSDGYYFGYCHTDSITGGCSVKDMQENTGDFEVYAQASKDNFISDLDTYPRFSYKVLEEKYEITELKVYNDKDFTTEDYDFYRGENLFVKFKVLDQNNNEVENMITKATLVSPPGGRADLNEIENTAGVYFYELKPIPLSHEFLGDSQVFTFAFNFLDNSGGQAEVSLIIRNNLPYILPEIPDKTVTLGKKGQIDLSDYENDLEDSGDDLRWEVIDGTNSSIFEVTLEGKKLTLKGIEKGTDTITVRLYDLDNDFTEQTFDVTIKKKKSSGGGGGGGGGIQIGFIEIFEDEPVDSSYGGVGFVDMPAEELNEETRNTFVGFIQSGGMLLILFLLLIIITIIVLIIIVMKS